jgi:hypothetical protein
MTSESWALPNIEFQTFDRLIDRRGDHTTSPATPIHFQLCTTTLLPNLCRNASKKDPAPRGAALFPAEDHQDIAAKTRHPPMKIVTSFRSPGVGCIDIFFDGHALDFHLSA